MNSRPKWIIDAISEDKKVKIGHVQNDTFKKNKEDFRKFVNKKICKRGKKR